MFYSDFFALDVDIVYFSTIWGSIEGNAITKKTARIENSYFSEVDIRQMNWYRSPIKYACDVLGKKIRQTYGLPGTIKIDISEGWENMPQELLDNIVLHVWT